ncbi:MAG: hypothetical protein H7Y10_03580 [Flavobacterium sp.]|nr:hypothetical protein [Flavobacterium sp.]
MDWFTLFLVKLSQPLIFFLDKLFALVIKIDRWWSKKNDYTKLNLRWIIFNTLLFVFAVSQQIQVKNAKIINDNRNTVNTNFLVAKVKELEEWKINRLENEITELKETRKIALENEKEIQRLNSKK